MYEVSKKNSTKKILVIESHKNSPYYMNIRFRKRKAEEEAEQKEKEEVEKEWNKNFEVT